jgi:hypothetical protein
MRSTKRLFFLLAFGLVLILSVSAQAAPTGILNITGEVYLDKTHFDWLPLGTGSGTFLIGSSSTDDFSPLGGTTGAAKDLDFTVQPVGVPFLLQNYLTFAAEPNLSFDLNFIFPGTSIGALILTDIPNVGVSLTWGVQTKVTAYGESACFTGIYSSQVNGTSSQVLAALNGGGAITTTYSASFSPCPTPLPATAPLLLTGLAGLGWHLNRRRHA